MIVIQNIYKYLIICIGIINLISYSIQLHGKSLKIERRINILIIVRRFFTAFGIFYLLPFNIIHISDLSYFTISLTIAIFIIILTFVYDSFLGDSLKTRIMNMSVSILSLIIVGITSLLSNPGITKSSVLLLILAITFTLITGVLGILSTRFIYKPKSKCRCLRIMSYIFTSIGTISGIVLIILLNVYPPGLHISVILILLCFWILLPYLTPLNPLIHHFCGKKIKIEYQIISTNEDNLTSFKTEEMSLVLKRKDEMDSEISDLQEEVAKVKVKVDELVSNEKSS